MRRAARRLSSQVLVLQLLIAAVADEDRSGVVRRRAEAVRRATDALAELASLVHERDAMLHRIREGVAQSRHPSSRSV